MSSDTDSDVSQEMKLARLAAVQALYQMALSQKLGKQILAEFKNEPSAFLCEDKILGQDSCALINKELFGEIVLGVERESQRLDAMIADAASSNVSYARLEVLLRAILRAGLFELQRGGVSAGVIINDYVDIAYGYFSSKEPGLVNAILDKVAKALRQS